MKKATCMPFVNTLNTLHEKGITSKVALTADPSLYADFWFAVKAFCHFALLSKTGGKKSNGEILLGNVGKIDALVNRGVTTRDDIETDCLIKIMDKLDLVLRQPIEKQKNYCYAICNNLVNDCFRKLPPDDMKLVSLNSTIEGGKIDKEDAYTYEEIVEDQTYNPERKYFEAETLKELQAQKVKELAETRAAVLREIELLAKHPAEVMVRLACVHLGMKPRELAGLVLDKGCEHAFAQILFEIARKNNLELSEIRAKLASHSLTAESVKADTNSPNTVAGQISRLVYRADKRLHK